MMQERPKILAATGDSSPSALETQLNSLGFPVLAAHSVAEINEKAKQAPAVLIIENNIPDMNVSGIIVSWKGNNATGAIPIIVMTGPAEAEVRLKALEAGADEFITRPPDRAELQARLRAILQVKAYHDHLNNFEKKVESEVGKRTEVLKQSFEKIKVASLDTVFRLSRAAEYKDTDTGAHIERMSHYSTAIARQMKVEEAFIENILYAAPMHDIGKIGIPDNVLQKPGKLDDNEWVIMRKHTEIGASILKDSKVDFMKLAEEIALAHHEKWDGTGYPRKLKSKDIPLGARIVALADVFDALTSERPYKKPMELEKSCSIILEGKGTHFDPDVVDAFFGIKEEIAASLNWWKFMGSDSEENDLFK